MVWRQRRIDPKDFWTWKSNRVSWCLRCHRTIEKGDVVRFEEFYDNEGKYEAVTHNDCREVRDRARLPAPEPVFVLIGGGKLRRMIMDVKNTTPEEQQKQETTTKRQKSSGAKKSVKGTEGTKAKKASSKSNDSKTSRTPMVVTVAERLAPHFDSGKKPAALKLMAKGEIPSNSDLVALRDAVNELAKKYREEGKREEASVLSATNALVRRLERATR